MFWHIPLKLSKHDKRYNLSYIDPNTRIIEYKGPINWLDEAMIINISEKLIFQVLHLIYKLLIMLFNGYWITNITCL